MIQINIVDTLLEYIGEYVKVNICDLDTYKIVSSYDGHNSIDEKYLGCEVKDFVVDNGLVTIWIEIKQLLTFKKRCGIIRRKLGYGLSNNHKRTFDKLKKLVDKPQNVWYNKGTS